MQDAVKTMEERNVNFEARDICSDSLSVAELEQKKDKKNRHELHWQEGTAGQRVGALQKHSQIL